MAIRIGSLAVILLLTSALAWNQEPAFRISNQSQRPPQPSISTARLRVPHQARRLYEKAIRPFREHRYDQAQRHLHEALRLYPGFPEALTLLGYIQLDRSQWEAAEQSLQAAVRSDPTYGVAYLILGHLYNMQKRFDDAVEMSQRASALMPDDWLSAYEMCTSFIKTEQYSMALSLGDAALRTTHGTMLHVVKAHALIGLKRYSEAVAELRTYLSREPTGEGSQDAHKLLDSIQTVASQGTREAKSDLPLLP